MGGVGMPDASLVEAFTSSTAFQYVLSLDGGHAYTYSLLTLQRYSWKFSDYKIPSCPLPHSSEAAPRVVAVE